MLLIQAAPVFCDWGISLLADLKRGGDVVRAGQDGIVSTSPGSLVGSVDLAFNADQSKINHPHCCEFESMNQYQANHNPSPKPSGKKGLLDFFRVLLLLACLLLGPLVLVLKC